MSSAIPYSRDTIENFVNVLPGIQYSCSLCHRVTTILGCLASMVGSLWWASGDLHGSKMREMLGK